LAKRRGCEHEAPKGSAFCQKCGAPGEVEYRRLVEGCIPKQGRVADVTALCGVPVLQSMGRTFVGKFVKSAGQRINSDPVKLPLNFDVGKFKADLKAKLVPLGLWNEEEYGIWSIPETLY
jgi:hypothetical protein